MLKRLNNIFKNVDIKFYLFERFTFIIGIVSITFNKFFYPNSFTIGKDYKLWGILRLLIDGNGKISIGNNFHGVSSSMRSYITLFSNCRLTSIRGGIIKISDNVGINGTTIVSKKSIEIGKNTIIAPNTIIIDFDGHQVNNLTKRINTKDVGENIIIGQNCWIGMNSIILKGVIIGDNTVIGAGSVVTKNCDKNSIYAGNPCTKIRDL
tara:strand:- start:38 stop:661 length:624 start_codon:yes stop_codon:yes gene_type:complete